MHSKALTLLKTTSKLFTDKKVNGGLMFVVKFIFKKH